MPRVKRGKIAVKKRRKILKATKGYRHARSRKERAAREALLHAGVYSFAHRRDKKNEFRRLFQVKINAAAREHGLSYSKLMGALHKKNILLDRKILAQLAEHHPKIFSAVLNEIK